MKVLLALDQGTTSSRALAINVDGQALGLAQQELTMHYPRAGWVEQDALEIWSTQVDTARKALASAGVGAADVAAIGISNQRETTYIQAQPCHSSPPVLTRV